MPTVGSLPSTWLSVWKKCEKVEDMTTDHNETLHIWSLPLIFSARTYEELTTCKVPQGGCWELATSILEAGHGRQDNAHNQLT